MLGVYVFRSEFVSLAISLNTRRVCSTLELGSTYCTLLKVFHFSVNAAKLVIFNAFCDLIYYNTLVISDVNDNVLIVHVERL